MYLQWVRRLRFALRPPSFFLRLGLLCLLLFFGKLFLGREGKHEEVLDGEDGRGRNEESWPVYNQVDCLSPAGVISYISDRIK
jgi:hypothetical protein